MAAESTGWRPELAGKGAGRAGMALGQLGMRAELPGIRTELLGMGVEHWEILEIIDCQFPD
jgi:hypothetical protein